ncbi:LIM domain only protein 7-like [Synchiropus splendidus]|uniref:LIM domain only protein 7-like n=1 Tax=Synchiropus splendidus TaxID=270530 RepID=UPI00237D9C42|nr:LIM domain only protein 7-like [Synchiropus splendidus]
MATKQNVKFILRDCVLLHPAIGKTIFQVYSLIINLLLASNIARFSLLFWTWHALISLLSSLFHLLCSTLVQAHTPPQPPNIAPLLLPPPLVFAPVDPTSGPRLVKCEKRPLLGRQDPREPPDPIDYDSIIPDLENDDMFTRRTLAFQSNENLVLMKIPVRRRLYSSEPQLNIITQRRAEAEEEEFPDIEEDDVVYRKEKTLQAQQQRPLSGAPDNYYPMPIPEPWALPDDLKARLLCPPCPLPLKSTANKENHVEDHPKTDDMLMRKLGAQTVNQTAPSVPTSCCEGDLQKWREIREASQIRYKKKLLVERLAALKMLN